MNFRTKTRLGFKYLLFSPLFGEDELMLTSIFFKWVVNHQHENPGLPETASLVVSNCNEVSMA